MPSGPWVTRFVQCIKPLYKHLLQLQHICWHNGCRHQQHCCAQCMPADVRAFIHKRDIYHKRQELVYCQGTAMFYVSIRFQSSNIAIHPPASNVARSHTEHFCTCTCRPRACSDAAPAEKTPYTWQTKFRISSFVPRGRTLSYPSPPKHNKVTHKSTEHL